MDEKRLQSISDELRRKPTEALIKRAGRVSSSLKGASSAEEVRLVALISAELDLMGGSKVFKGINCLDPPICASMVLVHNWLGLKPEKALSVPSELRTEVREMLDGWPTFTSGCTSGRTCGCAAPNCDKAQVEAVLATDEVANRLDREELETFGRAWTKTVVTY